jgi:dipeptidyl aminopeptidase/acylaminoacyl peptidase
MKKGIILLIILSLALIGYTQSIKKELTFDDILKWNRITEKQISNDGNFIVYKNEPWKGDAILKIANKSGKEIGSVDCGQKAVITNNSKFVVFTIKPYEDEIRVLKLKKTKKDDMPLNKLGIYNLKTKSLDTVPNLISQKVPLKWDNWIVYQTEVKLEKDTSNQEKVKEQSKKNGYSLTVRNLIDNSINEFPFVTDYILAKDNSVMAFVSTGDDKDFQAGLYYYDIESKTLTEVLLGKGKYKNLSFNKTANKLAFVADTLSDKKDNFDLYLWEQNGLVYKLMSNESANLPKEYVISENGEIIFSDNSNRVFFGIAPKCIEKDTTVLDEEIAKLDVWHWNEATLHTEQLYNKKNDLKKSYLSVYHVKEKKFIRLESENYSDIDIVDYGNSNYAIARSNFAYAVQRMWEGYPEHNDFYLININSGDEKLIKKDVRAYPRISTEGNYIYWYNAIDTTWNTYHIETGKEYVVTTNNLVQTADEINDIPNPADDYGIAGWANGDKAILIYDRYDIWKVDPRNKYQPENITRNGKQLSVNYRLVDFENAKQRKLGERKVGLDLTKDLLLKGHNEITREDGYYNLSVKRKSTPSELIKGKYKLSNPFKAINSNVYVFTMESFEQFPDLLVAENIFKKLIKISDANPQQDEFLWGTKELYTWTSLDGRKLEGILIKPANFDPNKKYPMIVNFYEKSSQYLYSHQTPEAHRSTVDYHYYSSNGYLIFNPDVYYKTGYPGEDAFNCVMPGVTQLISEGFVEKDHIAAQGHSWGGYQVAYLATRTNLFAAIESGAPVVNMFSAYSGIRMWSGRNRSFQYEHTQSRIGKSIWESPLRYLENSPLFTADKIQTPMLIMHNENDGAVPFSQGVEFFIALRRLSKKAWLLNYNEADHWPTNVRDKYDFQIRLAQFFDHYLKVEPMPMWMKEGVPAVNKGLDMGLELAK